MEILVSAAKHKVCFDKQCNPPAIRELRLIVINLEHLSRVLLASDLPELSQSAARPVSIQLRLAVTRIAHWFRSLLGFKLHKYAYWREMPDRG